MLPPFPSRQLRSKAACEEGGRHAWHWGALLLLSPKTHWLPGFCCATPQNHLRHQPQDWTSDSARHTSSEVLITLGEKHS